MATINWFKKKLCLCCEMKLYAERCDNLEDVKNNGIAYRYTKEALLEFNHLPY